MVPHLHHHNQDPLMVLQPHLNPLMVPQRQDLLSPVLDYLARNHQDHSIHNHLLNLRMDHLRDHLQVDPTMLDNLHLMLVNTHRLVL